MADPVVPSGVTCGVFVYGSLASPGAVGALLGKRPVEGTDFVAARLSGWRRVWNVCTDNTTSEAVRYYTPGTRERPSVQVVFLNVERDPGAEVHGYVIQVAAGHLLSLDTREANYDRTDVTAELTGSALPELVWTYVGKPDRVENARAAVRRGSARIRREYLDTVTAAFAGQDVMMAELAISLREPVIPVTSLERQTGPREPM